ncbi:hypothetical protein LZK73_15765 [Neorhizobium galegae]|nr:hypothetical protein LZK73_15765 [Neorhizobium galegae]
MLKDISLMVGAFASAGVIGAAKVAAHQHRVADKEERGGEQQPDQEVAFDEKGCDHGRDAAECRVQLQAVERSQNPVGVYVTRPDRHQHKRHCDADGNR